MSDPHTERPHLDDEQRSRAEPMAGAANTPPFEPNDAEERHAGRPPSHKEREQEASSSEERMEGIAPASGSTRGGDSLRQRAADSLDDMGDALSQPADAAADKLEGAADRLREQAEQNRGQGGLRDTAARWADRAAASGEDAADYLRDVDVDDLRALVERQVRDRPLQTILLAAATGWLVGKILR